MKIHDWSGIEREELNAALTRQVVHTQNLTVARLFLKKGAAVPEHSHHNEQVTMLMEGRLLFRLEGRETVVNAGQALEIPPHVPHAVEALEDSIAIDLFAPRREDWIRGDDAYLRR